MKKGAAIEGSRAGWNRNQLKYIAILAMLTDHMAWGFVDEWNPLLGGIMHVFGRVTGPVMAYFVAEGYRYTKDVGKYQMRLALFALLSWFPFIFFEFGTFPVYMDGGKIYVNWLQGVIFTLFLGLTAIRVWESSRLNRPLKIIGIALLCLLSCKGDWAYLNVLGCLSVHVLRDRPRTKWIVFTLIYFVPMALIALSGFAYNWFQLGVLLPPFLLRFLYNGQGGSKAGIHKWFFYLFYPLHLFVLGVIRWCL